MPRKSAGILLWRRSADGPELLLTHFGGPLWAKRDEGAWAIPKGELDREEAPLAAALREFEEELGRRPEGEPVDLGLIRQKGGKQVHAFAIEGDLDPQAIRSGSFEMEWPPRSGRLQRFPEVDRAAWFGLVEARGRILPSQMPLIDRLEDLLRALAEAPEK